MLGKVPNCGSGNFDIILDEEHMMELLKSVKETKENKYNLDEIDEEDEEEIECLEENLSFQMPKNEIDKCYVIDTPQIKIMK